MKTIFITLCFPLICFSQIVEHPDVLPCQLIDYSNNHTDNITINGTGWSMTGFNWKTETYTSWIKGPNNQSLENTLNSPFFDQYSGNPNIQNLIEQSPAKDYSTLDGWEVVKYYLGSPGTVNNGSNSHHIILYNRFSGILRVFYNIAKSEAGNGAEILVKFSSDYSNYASALLSFNEDKMGFHAKLFNKKNTIRNASKVHTNNPNPGNNSSIIYF